MFPLMPIIPQWSGSGPNLTYVGTTLNLSGATTYTFTNHAIGAASADRYVIVCASGVDLSNPNWVNSITIGGVSATLITKTVVASLGNNIAMYGLLVPSGTTATIVVAFSGSMGRASVSVYTMTGWKSTTAFSTGLVGSVASSQTLNLITPYGAKTLAFACYNSVSGITIGGTSGITSDYAADFGGVSYLYAGRSPMMQSEATLSSIATGGGGNQQFCLIAATFT